MASVPETHFLTLCLPHTPAERSGLTKAFAAVNWPALLRIARRQGMLPLLAAYLLPFRTQLESEVPSLVRSELRVYQEKHLFSTITQTAALIELQREFDREGVMALPWKGPSMGMLLYGAATLRESVDLDFLFLEKDIRQVLQIARRLGYHLLGGSDDESKDIYILSHQREFTFARKRDRLVLEFHLQVLPSRFLLWQNSHLDIERASTRLPIGGVTLKMQGPEDLLVSLCAHATKHNWDRLKWSCDIAQFLTVYGEGIPWDAFLKRLHRQKRDGVVLLGLALASQLFERKLPEDVQRALQLEPAVVALAASLAAHLLEGSIEPIASQHRKAVVALLCPRLRDRIAYVLLPIIELNYDDLYIPIHNRLLFFLNYGFRVVRLLRKYGPQGLASKTAGFVRSVH
jgi:hypothetical protein